MKTIAFLTLCGLLSLAFTFHNTRLFDEKEEKGTSYYLNGKTLKPSDLQHQIMCLDQKDTFSIQYTPAKPDENSMYVIGGVELWAQVSMGQPKVIGRLAFSEPAQQPTMNFTLSSFNAHMNLPEQKEAVRVTLRVAQILRVQGKRMLGFEPLDEKKRSCSFMLAKACQ